MSTHDFGVFADRNATPEQHLQTSDSLRHAAQRSLATGDLAYASEGFWGMVAHLLQAIAEIQGMRHETNLDFRVIMEWLVAETGNGQLNRMFRQTYDLHRNFYRIVMTREEIEIHSRVAIALADAARPFAQPA